MGIDLAVVLRQPFPYLLFSTLTAQVWHHWMLSMCNISLIMTKYENITFRLHSEIRTGSLIIMSLLHSAQGEPSISCHSVWVYGVIFSKVQPIRTDLLITSLCDSAPTHCCTWMYLSGSVITTGVISLRLMADNETGIQERKRGEEHGLSSVVRASAYTQALRKTHKNPRLHTHTAQMRI